MTVAFVGLAAWSLFAFAGAYHWTVVPILLAALVIAVLERPRPLATSSRFVDGMLLAALAVAALQLVPVPPAMRGLLSPASAFVHQSLDLDPAGSSIWRPLSLDPAASLWSVGIALACLLVFWSARQTFDQSSVRRLVYGVAWCGLALAVLVFLQRASSPHLIYGFWAPITRTQNPTPLGPFVNRNDLATWLLLAIPLVLGYVMARVVSRTAAGCLPSDVASAVDVRMVVLVGSLALMSAALLASLSRSGLIGASAGLLTMGVVARRRMGAAGGGAFVAATIVLVLIGLQYTNTAALAARLGDSLPADVGGRLAIWRETWPMARDFLVTGIGVGAFERGMLIYQHGSHEVFINHAHNEYLQVLTEGGLAVAIAAVWAIVAAARLATRLLRDDTPRMFWIRTGALSGLLAVAVQSIWDTGLRMPANTVLFAIAAALALHDPTVGMSDHRRSRHRHYPGAPAHAEN